MLTTKKSGKILVAITALGLMFACSEKNDDDDDTAATGNTTTSTTTTTTTTDEAETNAALSSATLDDLSLSGALALTIPDAISNSTSDSSSLFLNQERKSFEACEVGRVITEGLEGLSSVGNMFCHLEVESDNIEPGVKYKVSITGDDRPEDEGGGDSEIGIWIDNSVEGVVKVNFCQDGELQEIITVTDIDTDSKKAKGTLLSRGSETRDGVEATWQRSMVFDTGVTTEGTTFISSKDIYSQNSETFKRHLVMSLVDDGVHKVSVSNKGEFNGETFAMAGAARLNDGDDGYGQVILSNSGSHQGEEFSWTHKGFYSGLGFVVGPDATSDFDEDGALYVEDEEVPQFLGDSFSIDEFGSDAWDCSHDEEVSIDMSGDRGDDHNACEPDRNDNSINCWGDSFEQSDQDHEVDADKQRDPEDFDEHPHDQDTDDDE